MPKTRLGVKSWLRWTTNYSKSSNPEAQSTDTHSRKSSIQGNSGKYTAIFKISTPEEYIIQILINGENRLKVNLTEIQQSSSATLPEIFGREDLPVENIQSSFEYPDEPDIIEPEQKTTSIFDSSSSIFFVSMTDDSIKS